MIKKSYFLPISSFGVVLLSLLFFSSSINAARQDSKKFATWDGTGPDKWASVWLINRFVSPKSTVEVFPSGYSDEQYTFFDIPGVNLNRDSQKTSFAKIKEHFQITDSKADFINRILHDIDIRLWQGYIESFSETTEAGYRFLQDKYGRDSVHPNCYMQFFDKVALWTSVDAATKADVVATTLIPGSDCHGPENASMFSPFAIPELNIADVLRRVNSDFQIVFVDVRETAEFLSGHIPGAINIKIRDLNADTIQNIKELSNADLVIPYCVKDFRGYEMAKKLKHLGAYKVALMKPYGLKGWLHSGLPLSYGSQTSTKSVKEQLDKACSDREVDCELSL